MTPGTYTIKDVFLTVQGEGSRAGCKSVFVRLSLCNLWSGDPKHRDKGKGACARWCDTDFVGGAKMATADLLDAMEKLWPKPSLGPRWCVLTGGEPMLQVDEPLLDALHGAGWKVAMETNGTLNPEGVARPVLDEVDWLCVSPKKGTLLKRMQAHELKVVLPGAAVGEAGWSDEELEALVHQGRWENLFVQPQDPIVYEAVETTALKPRASISQPHLDELRRVFDANVARCRAVVMANPGWRISCQTHKVLALP